jgi:hypothetical protein
MAPQAMIVFRVGHPTASVITTMACLIYAVTLMTPQAMIVLRVGHPTASIVASLHVTSFIKAVGFVAS